MNTIEKALQKKREAEAKRGLDAAQIESEFGEKAAGDASSASERTKNYVDIDLDGLEAAGYLTPQNGRSRIAEEMRAIKRPLLRNAFDKNHEVAEHNNLIMITSAVPGEGKSFNSINLAISIAMELDRKVLLVDADVAKPSVMRYLGVDAEKGLVDYLLDKDLKLSDLLVKTNVPELTLLPAGRQHAHATELLASDVMVSLMQQLSKRYPDRVVIFDSPPLLATSESRVLATHMGQVLVVVESVKTTQPLLKEALTYLNTKKQIVGMVLNKTRGKSAGGDYGSYYGYGYGYGANAEGGEKS